MVQRSCWYWLTARSDGAESESAGRCAGARDAGSKTATPNAATSARYSRGAESVTSDIERVRVLIEFKDVPPQLHTGHGPTMAALTANLHDTLVSFRGQPSAQSSWTLLGARASRLTRAAPRTATRIAPRIHGVDSIVQYADARDPDSLVPSPSPLARARPMEIEILLGGRP